MFDLFRSRAKAMRYLLIVLLSLVALSMVITLIPGFGSSPIRSNEQVLAEIGDEAVTTRMVAQVVQMQIKNQQMSPAVAELMIPQIVNQIVGELATSYQARRMGFSASDEEVAQQIRGFLPQLFQGGQFAGKEIYQEFLARQMNLSIGEFEAKIRQQILLEKLQRVAFDGIIVAPKEVESEFQRKGAKARLDVVRFDPTEIRKDLNPTREELAGFLKERRSQFMIPATRNLTLVVADADRLGESLPITDAALRQAYASQRDRYKVDEKVKVRHILVKAAENAGADEKKKAKAKAEDLLKQIKSGADFAELAKKNSEDPGSASKGGDLDWVTRGQTVKPFEDTAFALKPKEMSGVVETMFGYHIIQTTDKQPLRMKPFEEVKDELLTEMRKRQLFEKMPALIEQARAELQKTPGQAAQIAQKLGLAAVKATKVKPGDAYPEIGANRDLDAVVASLTKGGVTSVVQSKDNKLAVAVMDDLFPARPAELSEMEKEVREAYKDSKSQELVESRGKEFEKRLKANHNDLGKTAAEMKAKVIDTGLFERLGQLKDIGPAAYFGEQPWSNPVGAVVGMYRVANVNYFFKITGKQPANASELESQRGGIVAVIKERKLRERREMFEEGLVRQLKAEKKIKVNEDAIRRLATSYRGA